MSVRDGHPDRPGDGRARRVSTRGFALGAGAALVAAMAAVVLSSGGARAAMRCDAGNGWLVAALSSRLSLTCAAVGAASIAGLSVLGGVCRLAGARRREMRAETSSTESRDSGQDGAAILEFALVLPFVLMFALIMTQVSLLMSGNLCVNYAAYCAARCAIVTVPANLDPDEPRNVVSLNNPSGSAKLLRMKEAAAWALLPVSCGSEQYPADLDATALADGLEQFFSAYDAKAPGRVTDRAYLSRKWSYANEYTDVELKPPVMDPEYGPHEDLQVRVTHVLYLSVPYANAMFVRLAQLAGRDDGRKLDFGDGEYGMAISADCRLTNEGVRDDVPVERFPHEPGERGY